MKTHTRYTRAKKIEVPRHGGMAAREWRRRVAQSAVKPRSPPLKTLSFPLEAAIPSTAFGAASQQYNTIEGVAPGSLFYLLLHVHLAGVGLFQKREEADSWRNEAAFPDGAFNEALREDLGIDAPKLTPRALYNLFKTVPKGSLTFSLEAVANRIHASCFGRSMDERTPSNVCSLFNVIASAVVGAVGDYRQLAMAAADVLFQVGEAVRRLAPSAPSLRVKLSGEAGIYPLAYTGVVEPVSQEEDSTYWMHHVIACLLRKDPAAKPGQVQDALLSFSDNALSNLFGAALFSATGRDGSLRGLSLAELMDALGIPPERQEAAERLRRAILAVPPPSLFREAHYSNYRRAVGGKLRSWISNYLNRLAVLVNQLEELKQIALPSSSTPALERILDGLGISTAELGEMSAARAAAVSKARTYLDVLAGRSAALRAIECASRLDIELQLIRSINGQFESVANQIRQLEGSDDHPALLPWQQVLSTGDAALFILPRLTGGNDDTNSVIESLNGELHRLLRALEAMQKLLPGSSSLDQYMSNIAEDELARARQIPGRQVSVEKAQELARRRWLSGIARLATRLSPSSAEIIWQWLEVLIRHDSGMPGKSRKIFNRLRYNNQGRLYISPWSPARHEPLTVDWHEFANRDWIASLTSLLSVARGRLAEKPEASSLQDYIEVLRFEVQTRIDASTQEHSAQAVRDIVAAAQLPLHYHVASALSGDTVDRKGMSATLTVIGSHLSRMRFMARRESFIVRQKFSRVGQDDLLYVPKDKTWSIPQKYFQAKGIIGQLLRSEALANEASPVAVSGVYAKARAMALETGVGHLLQQLPHDWYLPIEFKEELLPTVSGLPVGKDSVRKPQIARREKTSQAARLIGPSTFLNQLSGMLRRQTEAKEWMLILDWRFRSTVTYAEGLPSIKGEIEGCQPRVAVPVEALAKVQEKIELFDHLLAIDLGERQIGYALFDLRSALTQLVPQVAVDPLTGQPANGAIRVPGVRGLINAVRSHRGRQSANSKLRQTYDSRLKTLRSNVAADIVQRIEVLCARFNAFPVLESSVVNFQTGSRQLDLVYGDVVRHFTYSDVDAHQSARTQHWMGAERWLHPYLLEQPFDKATGRRLGKPKPVSLFPGAVVNPAGTSQVCVECGRNAILALKQLGDGSFDVADGGLLTTPNGTLKLMGGWNYTAALWREAKRNKRNLPMNDPIRAGKYRTQDLQSALRRTMRQKNPSVMARDTTQSRFQCTFADCGSSYHADQGAAINIGRKFLSERILKKESAEKLMPTPGS